MLALWAVWYAAYLYYAFGAQGGMIGEPRSPAQFREINLAGGLIILTAALLPPIAASLWWHRRVRNLVVAAGWVGLVGCWTHAITDQILRLLSLAGVHPTPFSPEFWLSIDRPTADLEDVVLNEPWSFVEGFLAGLVALTALPRAARPRWLRSAPVACAVPSIVGVLSGLDAIPRVVIHFSQVPARCPGPACWTLGGSVPVMALRRRGRARAPRVGLGSEPRPPQRLRSRTRACDA